VLVSFEIRDARESTAIQALAVYREEKRKGKRREREREGGREERGRVKERRRYSGSHLKALGRLICR
jgi:hypothetical protein